MNIHSQLIDNTRPLCGEASTSILLGDDHVTGDKVVVKRLLIEPRIGFDVLRSQLELLPTLAASGFLDFEDIVRRDAGGVDVSFRYVDVTSITQVLTEQGAVGVIDVLRQICQSIAYLHSLGFLHGDLKPANILLERDGDRFCARVTDLDYSVRKDVTLGRIIQGTEGYMAPEIAAGETLTESVDIYAFGATIRSYLLQLSSWPQASALQALADHCTQAVITDRPGTMWDVLNTLDKIARAHGGPLRSSMQVPPLRPAGLSYRVDRLRRALSPDDNPRTGVCVAVAPPGGGSSRVLRELCIDLQWAGEKTLRVSDVSSLDDLARHLPEWLQRCRRTSAKARSPILWVFVDTAPLAPVSASQLTDLNDLAIRESCVLIIEAHNTHGVSIPEACRVYRVAPLTTRECLIATGHLSSNPTVASANEHALAIAARGNPRLVQALMQRSLEINHTRSIQEPVNFDECDARIVRFRRVDYDQLPEDARRALNVASVFHSNIPVDLLRQLLPDDTRVSETLNDLVNRAWLSGPEPVGGEDVYAFRCRSARNAVRRLVGTDFVRRTAHASLQLLPHRDAGGAIDIFTESSLRGAAGETVASNDLPRLRRGPGGPVDIKLAVWHMLRHYRAARGADFQMGFQWAADIALGFAALGSVRRQRGWALRALRLVDQNPEINSLALETLRLMSRLLEMTGTGEERRQWLERMEDAIPESDQHARAFVYTELAAVAIGEMRGRAAIELALAADHLLARHAPNSEDHIRNLNRLGLAFMHIGKLATAEKHLERARRLARTHGFEHIEWRCTGNLGYVARAQGDPARAHRCARGISLYFRITDEKIQYLNGLGDQVLCLVDLGRLQTATRAARLAVALTASTSDPLRHGIALNNLGWVLSIRGEAAEARRYLLRSIAVMNQGGIGHLSVWARQNLAWLYLSAQLTEQAQAMCHDALAVTAEGQSSVSHVETHRILALAAIQLDDYEAAGECLTHATAVSTTISPKAQAQIDSIRLELYLWRGDPEGAESLLEKVTANPVFDRVQSLRLDAARHTAHFEMRRGNFDRAEEILSRQCEECHVAGRHDKQIDAYIVRSYVARAMGNSYMADRFASIAEAMIHKLRRELE